MNELIENRLSVRNALEEGLLSLEVDQTSDYTGFQLTSSQAEKFINQLEKLTAEIQRHNPDFHVRKSEVAHVG